MDTSEIGKRMKQYEDANNPKLIDKLPVILRLDGVSFHSFTRGMERPFDNILTRTMQDTMLALCEHIPGCVIGYTQSDEITIVLADYRNPLAQPWRGYVKRKLESVTASMATKIFNHVFSIRVNSKLNNISSDMFKVYSKKFDEAMFDCRAFNLPVHEVINNLIWRQCDCMRNSIMSVGQANFSHGELQNKSCNQVQEMLFSERGINWNDIPTHLKRGSCAVKERVFIETDMNEEGGIYRDKWVIDNNIPIFTKDRNYIDSRIKC